MIVVQCSICSEAARVICTEQQAMTLSRTELQCWGCGGRAVTLSELAAVERGLLHSGTRELTYAETCRACSGQGLPSERACSRDAVESLLRNKQIHLIGGHSVSDTRFCLEWIEFDSGHRMYFGASTHGAIVYKIVEPKEPKCEPSP